MASISPKKAIQFISEVNAGNFESAALKIFRFQHDHNPLYRSYCESLKILPNDVRRAGEIPFLPISVFKTHEIKTTQFDAERIFESSGTTGMDSSRHHVKDLSVYRQSFTNGFNLFYGPAEDRSILALLPSYLERGHSSLVFMAEDLIKKSRYQESGFYLHNHEDLFNRLMYNESSGIPTLLLGVTYALLDFAEKFAHPLKHTIIMETGGMKGRRKELLREEVHAILKESYQLSHIHSEYGMTELLSQAYSKRDGIFNSPPWMQVFIRDEDNPFDVQRSQEGKSHLQGAINIIDLANIFSCSFIATDDAGKLYPDGSFEVLGRLDNSDLRGCSLLTVT